MRVLSFGLALTMLATPANAITLKRGMPTDTWVTWPGDDGFVDNKFIDVFPEYRQTLNASHIKKVKDAGFDFMRLTIDPAIYIWKPSPKKSKKLNDGVLAAIAEIRNQGLNVIVDIHAIPASGRSVGTETYLKDDASFAEYLKVVDTMGRAISEQDPDHVAFEPMNEPTIDCPWENEGKPKRWPAMAKRMHDVAREAAPKLTILMQGACWGGAEGMAALDPAKFADTNMMWVFHNYEPFYFTHQGASWTEGAEPFFEGLTFPPDPEQKSKVLAATLKRIAASDKSEAQKKAIIKEAKKSLDEYYEPGWAMARLQEPVDIVANWAAKKNVLPAQILLGEFGVMKADTAKAVPESARAAYLESARKIYESHGWGWSGWSWGGSMSLTDDDVNRNPTPALMKALGLQL
jgi:endoglucanase